MVRDVVDKSTDSSNITIDKFNTEGLQTDASNKTKTRLGNTYDNSGGDNQRNASNAYIKDAAVEDKEPEHEDLLFIDPTPTDKSQHQLEHTQMSNASRVGIQLVHSERTLLDKPRRRKRQVADALKQSTTSKTSTGTKGSSTSSSSKKSSTGTKGYSKSSSSKTSTTDTTSSSTKSSDTGTTSSSKSGSTYSKSYSTKTSTNAYSGTSKIRSSSSCGTGYSTCYGDDRDAGSSSYHNRESYYNSYYSKYQTQYQQTSGSYQKPSIAKADENDKKLFYAEQIASRKDVWFERMMTFKSWLKAEPE